jgi:preprotein translocase subunit SecG
MEAILPYIQVVIGVFLVAAILMQQSDAGLGAIFGGGDTGSVNRTRRGFEKTLFNATIVLAIIFVLVILAGFAF